MRSPPSLLACHAPLGAVAAGARCPADSPSVADLPTQPPHSTGSIVISLSQRQSLRFEPVEVLVEARHAQPGEVSQPQEDVTFTGSAYSQR